MRLLLEILLRVAVGVAALELLRPAWGRIGLSPDLLVLVIAVGLSLWPLSSRETNKG